MAIVVSVIRLVKFQDCPVEGAHPIHLDDILTDLVLPPVNTVLPVISGDLTPGSVLITTTGTWTSTQPITYTYQWTSNGVPIIGATFPAYILTEADIGSSITVRVTATNMAGSSTVTAVDVNGVEPPPVYGLLNSYLPKVTGTLKVGETLTTDNGGWVGTPPPTFTYSWQRDGVDIPGATTNTYVLVTADAGHLITSGVTATNPADTIIAYSADMGPVSSPVVNTGLPVISGATVVGYTLTTTNGTWDGVPVPTFAYQWRRNGVAISGATGSTYTLVAADLGTMITVIVTATNPNNSATAISIGVGPIAAAAILNLSNLLVAKAATIGSIVGVLSVANGSGSYTYSLTSNPGGLFSISGSNLNVAAVLPIGTVTIKIQVSGGVPLPPETTFIITVAVMWNPATVANVVLSGNNLIATNIGTTSNDQGARV